MGFVREFPFLLILFVGSSRSCKGVREKIGIGVREPFFSRLHLILVRSSFFDHGLFQAR